LQKGQTRGHVRVPRAMAAVASGPPRRTNWLLFNETASSDRTSLSRPRRLVTPRSLQERQRATSRGAARHPDERSRAHWLLADEAGTVPLITRPRGGCCWGAVGAALRVCGDRPVGNLSPTLMNDSLDCSLLSGAYPDCSALGARALQPGLVSRLVFELKTEPTARQHFAQVGVARVAPAQALQEGRLDVASPLLQAILFTGAGDVMSTNCPLEAIAPGAQGHGLTQRMVDWCSGTPKWLFGAALSARILLEVDLKRGQVSISVGEWSEEPAIISAPGLLDEEAGAGRHWVPIVSLTAVGQEAKIVDLTVRADM